MRKTQNRIFPWNCRILAAVAVVGMSGILASQSLAQDYGAVGKRLRDAVEAGEITGAQARYMMASLQLAERLNDSATADKGPSGPGRDRPGRASMDRPRPEQARPNRPSVDRPRDGRPSTDRVQKDRPQTDQTPRSRPTKDRPQSDRVQSDRPKSDRVQTDRAQPNWEQIKKRIESAVERGDMTREDADAKYIAIKKRFASDQASASKSNEQRKKAAAGKGEAKRDRAKKQDSRPGDKLPAMKRPMADKQPAKPAPKGEQARDRRPDAKQGGQANRRAPNKEAAGAQRRQNKGGQSANLDARIRGVLVDAGIDESNVDSVVVAIKRLSNQFRTKGDSFEVPESYLKHLSAIGLNEEQIQRSVNLAKRLSAARPAEGANSENRREKGDG
ncbi:MAG: hypothetical protein R3C03_22985 [Pirellulaceae bacterium]